MIEGEIRDFVSFRPEPGAAIETWTDEPDYVPKATVDERAHFSLRIDVCRRDATVVENVFNSLIFGDAPDCTLWLEDFHFRARLGDRCSLTYRRDTLPKERGPLILWLVPCAGVDFRRSPPGR